jgi:hypothetical protein
MLADESFSHPGKQSRINRVAQSIDFIDDRRVAGLIRADLLVLEDTGIMLDNPVGHHDGENDCAATEPVGQQCGDDRGVDLAHPGPRQHHVVAVENPGDETRVRHCVGLGFGEGALQGGEHR